VKDTDKPVGKITGTNNVVYTLYEPALVRTPRVRSKSPKNKKPNRNYRIWSKWSDGMTYTELGKKYNLTPNRISQIVCRINLEFLYPQYFNINLATPHY